MLNDVIESAMKSCGMAEGDYIAADGLIRCGKCHTKKQIMLPPPFDIAVSCMCDCMENEYRERIAQKKKEETAARVFRNRQDAFGKSKYIHATFDVDDKRNVLVSKACRKYAEKFDEHGKWLMLYGNVGVGKSFIAAAIANYLLDEGKTARFTTLSEFERVLWDAESKSAAYTNLCGCSLLVLDDLGSERQTPYTNEILYNIIDYRLRLDKPMVVTTNLSQDDILNPAENCMQRIMSRMMENTIPILCKGSDRRVESMKANARKSLEELLNG